ncbi:MAG: MBL fold metallo-hydrolase [Clostridia bacterium]|nr:MBL fold metallo-hydrolase [Clostridia bacterium]
MLFTTLFSGSGGNCSYIKSGDTEILIDAGGSTKRIECALRQLDTCIQNISAIYITHEHSDHVASLPVLLRNKKIPVYITIESARCMCEPKNIDLFRECFYIIKPENVYETGDINLIPFVTPHDSAMSVGYRICSKSENVCIGYATDTGHVSDNMRRFLYGCKRVIVESNHDVEMLKNGPYPPYLKKRILSKNGHLSNEDCAGFLCDLADKGCESIILAHLSKENNTPDAAFSSASRALTEHGVKIGKDLLLEVAPEKCVCELC